MNCNNNFMGLIPSIMFRWSQVPLISFPIPPLQWSRVARHQAVGVFFNDWGRETDQGWGKSKWQELHIHPDQSAARKDSNTCLITPKKTGGCWSKNKKWNSLFITGVMMMNVYLIFFVVVEKYSYSSQYYFIFVCYVNPPHAVFISWGLTYWDPMVPQEATDEQRHSTSWMNDPDSAPFLCNRTQQNPTARPLPCRLHRYGDK